MQTRRTDIVIVPLEGDLDLVKVESLRAELLDLVESGCMRLILNMCQCGYIDSSGMALLVRIARMMYEQGGTFSLVAVNDQVYRSLCIACLVDFIPVSLKEKMSVPVLDPSQRPLWRRTLHVSSNCMESCRKQVQAMLQTLPMAQPDIFDMTLAGGEAIGNAIDHGGNDGAFVTCTGYSDRVIIEVSDNGEGFELTSDFETTSCSSERGRGIKLMHLLCDSVSITKKPEGSGTIVELVKLVRPGR